MKKIILPILLLFTSLSFAANSSQDAKIELFEDFSGGLNTQKAPHSLEKNQSPNMENVLIDDKPGSMLKRNGYSLAVTTPTLSKINFMFEQILSDGSRTLYVSDSSQVLATTNLQNFTVIKATLTVTAKLRAAQGRGFTLFTNGVDPVFISSGVGAIPLDGNWGRPNAPRAKFPAFFQERFFLYGTTENASAIHWTEISSTAGYVIPLTDQYLFPWSNKLIIGDGDGADGSGMSVFGGQLRLHKYNKSIYTLFGIDETDFYAKKTNSFTGSVAADSIVTMDNLEYCFAKDGVIASDSGESVRISDDIFPNMESVASNLSSIQTNIYDTQSDFLRGSLQNTTAPVSGIVTIVGTATVNSGSALGATSWNFSSKSSTSSAYVRVTSASVQADTNYNVALSSVSFLTNYRDTCGTGSVTIDMLNTRTGVIVSSTMITPLTSFNQTNNLYPKFDSIFDFTADDLRTGKVFTKLSFDNATVGCNVWVSSVSKYGDSVIYGSTNTGQFISDMTTATAISLWDTFDTLTNTNGGSISWYIRTATGLPIISTEPWTSIFSGNVPPLPVSRPYLQFAATISASGVDISTSVSIDRAEVSWNQGGAADTQPVGIEWKKRYWLLVATQPTGTFTPVYVKSRISNSNPNAWMKYDFSGDYFRSAVKFNDNLYFGSGSAGKIYRMDYGTNDNGTAINWFYETPDIAMGSKYKEKTQSEFFFDMDKQSGATFTFGTSVNGGTNVNRTFSSDGSGRLLKTIKHDVTSGIAKDGFFFRYKFANAELDKPMTFHGFGVVYSDTDRRIAP